jgi:hypothetical protein
VARNDASRAALSGTTPSVIHPSSPKTSRPEKRDYARANRRTEAMTLRIALVELELRAVRCGARRPKSRLQGDDAVVR